MNRFLHKGPQWKVDKLPSYWIDKIILQSPTEDDEYYAEIKWLLDFLIDGLRTANVSRPSQIMAKHVAVRRMLRGESWH